MRFSLLGQAAACKQQLLVGTSFAAFASGWIRKLTCSAVPPLQSKPAALGFALAPGEEDARLRPEWRQGIRKDRAANPVFSDITFKRRGRLLPSAAGPLPPPSGREAQSLRRCAPPPFTQGRHGGASPRGRGEKGQRYLSRRDGGFVPDKFSGRWWLWGAADV